MMNASYKNVLDEKSFPHNGTDRGFFFDEKRQEWHVRDAIQRENLGGNLENVGYIHYNPPAAPHHFYHHLTIHLTGVPRHSLTRNIPPRISPLSPY